MAKHFIKLPSLLLLAILFLAASNVSNVDARGLPTQQGILNFGKVSDTVYRGAQPDAAAIASLQRLGVKTIFTVPRWQTPWYKGIRGGNDKGAP